ncbi:hypothetical protein [Clostridium sporogenes]|uniref:hypothetical protein n=1 Tax=Clostridium sporogenes TaxID=1509 RepID=UPI0005F06EC0|nr:hypothetical protein [Clostridium sporogenes]NFQ67376.1 hypothetical protein [Clostridium sporogenes]
MNEENNKKKVRRYVDKLVVNNYIVQDVVRGLSERFEVDLIPEITSEPYNGKTIIEVYEVLGN